MAETAQNHAETVPPPVVTSTAEPAETGIEPSADETHLQSIFPDLDAATIHDCYVLCDRNLERTVEFLFGDASANVTSEPGAMSQNEIDEQLARHLEQEELSAAAANARAWNPQQAPAAAPRQPTSLRSSQVAPTEQGQSIEEQFNKIAETGKRTFNTIFNKVKEKLKEFEQPPPGTPSSSQSYYPPSGATVVGPQPRAAPSPYQASHAPPPGPPAGTSEQRTTTEPANPSSSTAAATAQAPSASPPIDVSKAAFLAKKPMPLPETSKPHPEEDLTENPFDDRTH